MTALLRRLRRALIRRLPDSLLPTALCGRKRELNLAEHKRALEAELRAAGYSKTRAIAEVSDRFAEDEGLR